jgi:hypothetical protein
MESKNTKRKKKSIPQILRELVWNKKVGKEKGVTKCFCCKVTEISQLKFQCGHIISEYNGGLTNIDNLLPICSLCNASMGRTNMYEFINKYNMGNIEKKENNINNNDIPKLDKCHSTDNTFIYPDTKNHILNENKVDSCEHCGLEFKNKSNYAKHIRKCEFLNIYDLTKIDKEDIYKLIKNLICPLCKYNASRHSSLSRHVKVCITSRSTNIMEVLKMRHTNELIYQKLKAKEEILEILTERNKIAQ